MSYSQDRSAILGTLYGAGRARFMATSENFLHSNMTREFVATGRYRFYKAASSGPSAPAMSGVITSAESNSPVTFTHSAI